MIKNLLGKLMMLGFALLAMNFINFQFNKLVGPGVLDQTVNIINDYIFIGGMALIGFNFIGDLVLTLVKGRC